MPLEPTRFVDNSGMLFAGIRRVHGYREAPQGIPAQWREFQPQMATMPGRIGTESYGVLCGNDDAAHAFEYMCAVRVESFDALSASFGRMRVKPQRYAVFTHTGNVSAIQGVWRAIWNDWFPRSGLEAVHGPEFEVYTDAFDPGTGQGGIEIWCPVVAVRQPR